jgi:hypothetical protein
MGPVLSEESSAASEGKSEQEFESTPNKLGAERIWIE